MEDVGGLALQTSYTFDALGNLTFVAQGNGGTRNRCFQYDSLSRLTAASNPEAGGVVNCVPSMLSGWSNLYSYDNNGNLTSKTDARGQVVSYRYDALNRPTWKTSPGARDQQFVYDAGPNGIGRLGQISDQVNIATSYNYDAVGNLTNEVGVTPSDGSYTVGVSAGYDLAGNMVSFTYPDGRNIARSFDGAGRLNSVYSGTVATPGIQYIGLTYYPSGLPYQTTLGNGAITTRGENNRLQTCSLQTQIGSTVFSSLSYAFTPNGGGNCGSETGNNGNIWQVIDHLGDSPASQAMQYDTLNRLSSWAAPNIAWTYRHLNFTYDGFGNMVSDGGYASETPQVGTVNATAFPNASYNLATWPYDTNNRLLPGTFDCIPSSGSSYYDAAGNQLCDGSSRAMSARQYSWNAESKMAEVDAQPGSGTIYYKAASYLYDALGERTRSDYFSPGIANSTAWREYHYFKGQVVAEKNQAGTWTDYIYAGSHKVAKLDSTDMVIHMSGDNSATPDNRGSILYYAYPWTPIGTGDKLVWRQRESGVAHGGIYVTFTDGTQTSWALFDTDGIAVNDDSRDDDIWHTRVVDLSAYAGRSLGNIAPLNEVTAGNGHWDIYWADLSLVQANGNVVSLYNGGDQGTLPASTFFDAAGVSNLQASTVALSETRTNYYTANQVGTSILELASTGWPVWQGNFAPFGQELYDINSTNLYRFTGKERDTESGLDYFGARYYASSMGRWMSPDWADKPEAVPYSDLTNPQSLNLYGYVNNNPLSHADADGHCDQNGQNCSVWDHVAGAVGGVLNVVPQTINLINSAGNAALSLTSTSYRIPMMDEIQPDAHASMGGLNTGAAAQILVPVGDLGKGAQILENAAKGAASEARVLGDLGVVKNTEAVVGSEGRSIPDFQTTTTVGGIKDVQTVSNTKQLRIQKEAALDSGRQHELHTGTNTTVTPNAANGTQVVRRPDLGPQ